MSPTRPRAAQGQPAAGPSVSELAAAALAQSRKSTLSNALPTVQAAKRHSHTAFFLRSEEQVERDDEEDVQEEQVTPDTDLKDKQESERTPLESSSYGVQSMDEAMGTVEEGTDTPSGPAAAEPPSPQTPAKLSSSANLSQPLTPIFAQSPTLESFHARSTKSSSLRSFKLYDDDESAADDAASQAITSGDEEEQHNDGPQQDSESPQFVMPSITIPSRRPFTEKGKQIGKLNIVVTGSKGSGKTSLIKSIMQLCEDIVHADSVRETFVANDPSIQQQQQQQQQQSFNITHIHASTRAFPDWWSDSGEEHLRGRRRGSFEPVLERNIRFSELPGVENGQGSHPERSVVAQYVEDILLRCDSVMHMRQTEAMDLFSGSGGPQIDLVILVLAHDGPHDAELALAEYLSKYTNVVPVIGRSDVLDAEAAATLKASLLEGFSKQRTRPTDLNRSWSSSSSTSDNDIRIPYLVSSLPAEDDNMDASLLMNSDYVQPLTTSELSMFVSRIFDPETAAWLRHSSSKKYLQWLRNVSVTRVGHQTIVRHPSQTQMISSLDRFGGRGTSQVIATTTSSPTTSHVLVHHPHTFSPFSLAHTSSLDHRTREERLAQVQMAKWATDLQRSLQNERQRFEMLQTNERAVWLTERVSEGVQDGTLVALDAYGRPAPPNVRVNSQPLGSDNTSRQVNLYVKSEPVRGAWTNPNLSSSHLSGLAVLMDPLGLLDFNDRASRRALVVAKLLGSCGVLAALAVWAVRSCGWWDGVGSGASSGTGIRPVAGSGGGSNSAGWLWPLGSWIFTGREA